MDTERTEVALVYCKSIGWIGGTYYMQNIVSALKTLDDKDQPVLNIYSSNIADFNELKSITGYKHLKFNEFEIKETFTDKVNKIFNFNHHKATHQLDIKKNVLIYPSPNPSFLKDYPKGLAWIADFQSRYFPSYFSWRVRNGQSRMHLKYNILQIPVVFSSQDALDDYKKFYPKASNKTYILRFAVTHPDFSLIDIDTLKEKFGITKQYFFCANQFWKHKNHMFLFKAFKKLIDSGIDMQLICSGSFREPRFPHYIEELQSFIKDNHLGNRIKTLGFIDRIEQLCLMKNSYAMIQPSLFEGWSTVVEDAKALNKFIFLSDLKVNIEQSPLNVCYFNPYDEEDLIKKLRTVKPTNKDEEYDKHIKAFAQNFISIINNYKCLSI